MLKEERKLFDMTTASKITMTRIALIPFFIVTALGNFKGSAYVALAIFIVSAVTDWVDGYIARHYNQVSTFGKFVDPLADKLLVTAALFIFVERGQMASWACWIVVAREFAVSGLRLVAMENGAVIAAAMSGKIKTFASLICCCYMLLPLHTYAFGGSWLTVDRLGTIIIVATTVYSGIEYFIVNRKALDLKD